MEILEYIVYAGQVFCFWYAFILLLDIQGHTKAMYTRDKTRNDADREETERLRSKNKQLVKNYEVYIADMSAALSECQASRKDAFEALKKDKVANGKTVEGATQSVKDFHEPLFEEGETERLIGEGLPKPEKKPNSCKCCAGEGLAANGFDDCPNCCGTGQANPLKTNRGYAEEHPKVIGQVVTKEDMPQTNDYPDSADPYNNENADGRD